MSAVELNLDRLEPGRSGLELDAVVVREDQVLHGHRVEGFQARITGSLDVDAMDQKVAVHGEFAVTREVLCDRSGEPFDLTYPARLDLIILRRPGRGSDAGLGQELDVDDNWVIHQPGGVVDLTEALLEAVVLDRPQHVYHPDHQDEVDASVPTDGADDPSEGEADAIDPRWAALKKLRDEGVERQDNDDSGPVRN